VSANTALEPPPYDTPFVPGRSPLLWFFEREVRRFVNIWIYAILGPVVSGLLFVVVFGSALGRHVDAVEGVSYGRFIVPGLLTQAVVNVGFFNGSTSLFEARQEGYIHDVFASPLRWWEINLAYVGAAALRGLLVGAGVLVTAAPLTGGVSVRNPAVLILGTVGLLVVAAQTGILAGALAKSLDHNYAMESIILLPLGFLGGIFYSVSDLPQAWSAISRIDPLFWLVQVERIGFLGHGDVPGWAAVLVVWGIGSLMSLWTLWIFATGRLKP
jgi:ABC-2 type transport system permease protein